MFRVSRRRDIRLMDVTEAGAPMEIAATVTEGKSSYTVSGSVGGSWTFASCRRL